LKAQITKKHTPYRHIRRNVDSAVARKLLQMGLHKIDSLNDLKKGPRSVRMHRSCQLTGSFLLGSRDGQGRGDVWIVVKL
jgi:Fe2+ transport system protein FeoA